MTEVSVIFGTRPEAIKLAPVVRALHAAPGFSCHVCVTAQHRQMLGQVLDFFEIRPDIDLNLMQPNQNLSSFASESIRMMDQVIAGIQPHLTMVQGDTTTAFTGALASFYHKVPVGHVEAGLRSHEKYSPFPEEANRILAGHLADLHFAPTQAARENLAREGLKTIETGFSEDLMLERLESFFEERLGRGKP